MYVRVDFPSGRCYAAQAFDPSFPEWPPHPSRLFSALVASAYQSADGMTALKRSTLQWLENLPAPAIYAPRANLAPAPVTYVPPGDSVGRKGVKGEEQFEHGVHRWRQQRYFPCAIIMGEPILYYDWPEDPDGQLFEAFEQICLGVTHIGTSHSMALVSVNKGKMPILPTLLPDRNGTEFLRTPVKGRLVELDGVHSGKAGLRRPTPSCETLSIYRAANAPIGSEVASKYEFIPLRLSGTMHGADTAAFLGRAMRRAIMSILGDNAPSSVHGHNGGQHVAWLPLPDVGHPYANGRIVGIGVALPQKMAAANRQHVLAGIHQLNLLNLPDGRIAKLHSLLPGEPLPVALKSQTWTRASDTWSTVTPVVIDRPPKKLKQERLREALSESIELAGYDKPIAIEISAFSRFKGSPPAFRVPHDKPRYHATVRFKNPIGGPVFAGRLRYFGIGLFRPILSPR